MDGQPGHIDQIKQINIGTVYRLIDQYGPISRIELSKKAQLAPASITKIVRELVDAHLVMETEFLDLGFRGRPATGLKLDSESWHFLCVSINLGSLILGLRDLSSTLIVEDVLPLPANKEKSFLDSIIDEIDAFFGRYQSRLERLTAISMTVNAIVDPTQGLIHSFPYYQVQELPIGEYLHRRTGLPVFLQHEITAWTIAESLYGTAKNCQNVIQMVIDEHVGVGVIIAGQTLHAGNRGVMEVGHIQAEPNGERCYCGNFGCLETVVGISHILSRAKRQLAMVPDSLLNGEPLTVESFCQAVNNGDTLAVDIIRDIGVKIGHIIAIMVNLFNPEKILMGSPLNASQQVLYPVISECIQQHALPAYSKQIELVPTKFNNSGTLSTVASVKKALYDGSLLINLMKG
ncbi:MULTISPECIES: ROK family transcriptional regulator [Photorhabdus]|uniref:sugar metabolism global transcriptional regulator Mlc n=1 Tax=Photorhabdus TaxID=29487 RepID=UPI0007B47903|nr:MULTISPECIES: ROK family transcriptional regulator [Photorhabdus]AWK42006.1 transcriptional regulator [Photorhabdus laumondii subsp. laumondii]AXG42870.1 transcriptional regulator [Photorhabdus laumondii subsp. laumondii]MCC8389207.1 ROK family transcriptional regulator [Photorhabdus laumondii]MCZ1250435.1 ROK family transcriptional regulator [Photorhabdus laumondii subsp. laumondii]NDL14778.1 ROK family protein [Photorhabdus laumondii subsp. laumondii]